jgi:hypothetical protein
MIAMKKLFFSRCVGIVFLSGTLCFLLVFSDKHDSNTFVPPQGTVPLRVSKATTVVTEPLLPEGSTVDFYAVLDKLCSADADADSGDNGFRDIVRIAGRKIFDGTTDEQWKTFCEKLNLNPDEPPQFEYVSLSDFLCDVVEKAEGKTPRLDANGTRVFADAIRSQSWDIIFSLNSTKEIPAKNLELGEQWAKAMEPVLSAVADSLKKPRYIVPAAGKLSDHPTLQSDPFPQLANLDWPDFFPGILAHREIFQMFSHRCLLRKVKHDAEGWEDVLSMFRMARHFGRQPFPDARNFANAYEKSASHDAVELLKTGGFDADQLRQCLADLDALPDRVKFEDTLEYQRLGWLKNISGFPQHGPVMFGHQIMEIPDHPLHTEDHKKAIQHFNKEIGKTIQIYRDVSFDWNIVAEIMNAEFDEYAKKPAKQEIFQSNPALRKIYEETNVQDYSFDDLLPLLKAGSMQGVMEQMHEMSNDDWNIDRLSKMSIEERSVYLGKAVFALRVAKPELFAYQNREKTTAYAMMTTVIALQLHKAEQGGYPASLAGLVEEGYLAEIPNDFYHDVPTPLSYYHSESEGSCILSNAGFNEADIELQ